MRVKMKVISGPETGRVIKFNKTDCLLFGRAKDAHLSLPEDPYVSRQHFLLEVTPSICRITDLGSKNGTFVNSVRYGGGKPLEPGFEQAPDGIMEAVLKDGDTIAVGNTMMAISIKGIHSGQLPQPVEPETLKDVENMIVLPGPSGFGTLTGEMLPEKGEKSFHLIGDSNPMQVLTNMLNEPTGYTAPDLPVFDGYRVSGIVGSGSMGKVYKAIDELTGMTVAIKVLAPRKKGKTDDVMVFRREVEITRQLRHKNIVTLLEHGRTGNLFYFVTEYVNGPNLDELIRKRGGRIDLSEAMPIFLGVLEGLAYAHEVRIKTKKQGECPKLFTGIVHRDIKPANILLSRSSDGRQWVPKISDFGLSKSFESAGLSDLTMPGIVAGTPVYWPREQITHYRYLNPATDVFSIAAVFYEALTGRLVRNGFYEVYQHCREKKRTPTIADFMRVLAENPPIPIRNRRKDIPKRLAKVIDRALKETETPSDYDGMRRTLARLRYPNASAFLQALKRVI